MDEKKKWKDIEDVPVSELPPLADLPKEEVRAVASEASPPSQPQSSAASPGGVSQSDTTLLSILNTLTRIEQMLYQMAN